VIAHASRLGQHIEGVIESRSANWRFQEDAKYAELLPTSDLTGEIFGHNRSSVEILPRVCKFKRLHVQLDILRVVSFMKLAHNDL
jgi:hypothetical protein